jgi:hypothetical protein
VLIVIGGLTHVLGIEAGLVALVLAVVALVAPHVYLVAPRRDNDPRHTDDERPDSDRNST